ncbi:hypothetical protein EJB05_22187, partial [Eragrostis curvula]
MQCLQLKPANRPSMATVAREIEFGVVQGDTAGGEGRSGAALESGISASNVASYQMPISQREKQGTPQEYLSTYYVRAS